MKYIKTYKGSDDWICLCGNEAIEDGFYPCDSEGKEVEPTVKEWTTGCYVCDRCGRIIRQRDRAIVGQRKSDVITQ